MNGEAGLSLLEVMIAMAVLSIGLLGIDGLLIATIKGDASARKMTTAVSLAEARMEKAKSVGFSTLSEADIELCIDAGGIEDYGTIKIPKPVAGICTTVDPDAAGFRRETVVLINGNLKTVTVTVLWQDRNRTRSVQLTSLVAG
ncbi:MAG: prepilin-type N-terminal cleavage/methylation domain-containing protein [Dehalococcoidia bacterium]